MDSLIPNRGDLPHDPKGAFSFPTRSLICSDVIFAQVGNCLVKLQPSLEFECYCVQIRFHNDPEFLLDIFRGVFSCGLLVYDRGNRVITAV